MPAPPRALMVMGPSASEMSNSIENTLRCNVMVMLPEAETKPRKVTDPLILSLKPASTVTVVPSALVSIFCDSEPM